MFPLERQCIILDNNLILETPQPEDVVESNCKELFDMLVVFECPHLFGILGHNILPALITLRFDLLSQNLRTEVLGLTSNVSKK